ncbi:hypothetical protein SAMN04488058_101267 [Deinococcus reticulitermitis]|uniref:Uncharacterized protein n=1 Tax=Deinococcus reticulitermitis TaxID=856736 RepID=A0A1H6SDC0_9DEIO|nr:hypothetical protein [Deinococcus reticulitermitis]SEI66013.1 hypothetical protein SAMN04488058_101267 [Deinococcus reticulitermitis]
MTDATLKATPKTAADRDTLISAAQAAGLPATRTAKDFFIGEGEAQERVTPARLIALIHEAQREARERAEAFEAAEAIRAEIEVGEEETEAPGPVATADPPAPQAGKPAGRIIKYGPPCGGDVSGLAVAVSDEARNPLMHLQAKPRETYATKDAAAAAGRQLGKGAAWIAFLALADGETFWALATVQEGELRLDGQAVTLSLLQGEAAEAARARVEQGRLKTKTHWQVSSAA